MVNNGKNLYIFAGPNGSGKSTLFKEFSSKFSIPYFINADHVEKKFREVGYFDLREYGLKILPEEIVEFCSFLLPGGLPDKDGFYYGVKIKENVFHNFPENPNSDEASFIAFLRKKCIQAGHSFAFETVLCHPSKFLEIEFAVENGYKPFLYFVGTESPLLNKMRIENRVYMGGHKVNQKKIYSRYNLSMEGLISAINLSYKSFIFDNSGKEYKLLGEFYKGVALQYFVNEFPEWFKTFVLKKLKN